MIFIYTNLNVPVAPREPFQPVEPGPLFELRQGTPPLPPLFKLPQTQADRTPDAAGLQLKPAPKHRITLKILFYLQIGQTKQKGLTAPLLRIHPVFTPLNQVLPGSRTST